MLVGTTEKQRLILELHNSGLTPLEMVEEAGVSRPTVYQVLKKFGLKPNVQREVVVHDEKILEAMAEAEATARSVADALGVSVWYVYRVLRTHGTPPPSLNNAAMLKRQKMFEAAAEMYKDDKMTLREICEATGVQQPALHAYIRANNIPLRNRVLNSRS